MQPERFTLVWKTAVDREMFTLQTIRVKNVEFSRFHSLRKIL